MSTSDPFQIVKQKDIHTKPTHMKMEEDNDLTQNLERTKRKPECKTNTCGLQNWIEQLMTSILNQTSHPTQAFCISKSDREAQSPFLINNHK